MSYKTVAVYARNEAELERVLSATRVLLQDFPDTHMIGVYSAPSPVVYADPNGFIDPGIFEETLKQNNILAHNLQTRFEAFMRENRASFEFRIAEAETGTAADGVLGLCTAAELLIAGQPDPNDAEINDETADTLVFNACCPVLLIPYAPVLQFAGLDRVTVAFNGKREASRAAFDAVPFLKVASQSELVWIDPPALDDQDAAVAARDLVSALARHGVDIVPVTLETNGRYAHDVLRDHIIAERADLLVMGAYSRSRLREFIFGGMTRALLGDLPIPTLFSR